MHWMTSCYLHSGKGSPFLRDANKFTTKLGRPNYSFLLVGIPMGLWGCTHSGGVTLRRGFTAVLGIGVVMLIGFHFFTVGEAVPKRHDRPLRGRRTMIINLVNANADRGIEKDHNNLFVVNSLKPRLDAPIASTLSNFNVTTFRHDVRSNETALPSHARIHHTHYTA